MLMTQQHKDLDMDLTIEKLEVKANEFMNGLMKMQ